MAGALLTCVASVIVHRAGACDKWRTALSGVCFPAILFFVGSVDVICFQDVDGPPPGMMLLGLLLTSIALLPFTSLMGLFMARRAPH
ncbi:hypothetical protein [Sphingobium sp. BS19]|uniref:hypothetical protein n=1 Tax=Sphingobium sp. BS19 TaxID=3018973 RepID=UPI002491E0D7|nr:hypothetical protein [Sphingobium sp. BS19]